MRNWIDELTVACVEGSCSWRGTKSSYSEHKCPFPASEHVDGAVLRDIIYEDARSMVKLKCIEVIAGKVIPPDGKPIDSDKLEQVYSYMKLYPWFVELQAMGMKLFAFVLDTPNGVATLEVCDRWREHVKSYEHVPSLKELIGELCAKYDRDIAKKLGSLKAR